MNITQLKIDIPAHEIRSRFAALKVDRKTWLCDIENAAIKLEEGKIVVTCTLNPMLCPRTPATIYLSLSIHPVSHALVFKIESVEAQIEAAWLLSFDVSDCAKEKIIEAIKNAVRNKRGFSVIDNSLFVHPEQFLAGNAFLRLSSRLTDLEVRDDGITLKFS